MTSDLGLETSKKVWTMFVLVHGWASTKKRELYYEFQNRMVATTYRQQLPPYQ